MAIAMGVARYGDWPLQCGSGCERRGSDCFQYGTRVPAFPLPARSTETTVVHGQHVEGWNDATPNVVPDWIQVDFAGSKTIDEISVFSLHDNYTQENTPTETQTFTLYGLLAFDVQYWNGSSWVTIPGGSVTGNNKVWRKFTFSPITTSKIRVYINTVPDAWSRVVEIQAFGPQPAARKSSGWYGPSRHATNIIDQTGTLAKSSGTITCLSAKNCLPAPVAAPLRWAMPAMA